jgi:predicted dinucleotide-binding enzyme
MQHVTSGKGEAMKIGILGTGNLATTLGAAWTAAGHSIVLTGRSADAADEAARQIGRAATTVDPARLAVEVDVVVVAIPWTGLDEALALVGAANGALVGKAVIDCTNPLDFATGAVLPEVGSAAERISETAVGAHVVKALHMFAGASWPFTGSPDSSPVVAICGNDRDSLSLTAELIGDLGGRAVAVGGLDAARQLEEVAGFVVRVVATGTNPRFAVPDLDPALVASARSGRDSAADSAPSRSTR